MTNCMMCGRGSLLAGIEITNSSSFDDVGLECPRCKGVICKDCFKKIRQIRKDDKEDICPFCNKRTGYEVFGIPNYQLDNIASKYDEEEYR